MRGIAARIIPFVLVMLVAAAQGQTREQHFSLDDVLRRPAALMPRPVLGVQWQDTGDGFSWFSRNGEGWRWVKSTAAESSETLLMDEKTFKAAAEAGGVTGLVLPALSSGSWSSGGTVYRVFDGKRCIDVGFSPPSLRVVSSIEVEAQAAVASPDRRHIAYVEDFDVHVKKPDGTTFDVTSGGHADMKHGLSVSRDEFGIHDGLWWDPSGRRLAFYREDMRPIEPHPYIDWKTIPATLVRGRYPMAGRRGSVVSIGVYDSRDDSLRWLLTDPSIDEYLTNVTWNDSGDKVFVAHVNRDQNHMKLVRYDTATGAAEAVLFEERDEQWIEPEHGPIFVPKSDGRFLWFSYRDGFNHLYLHAADGHLMQQCTRGAFDVTDFVGFDADGTSFWCQAAGPDPRQKHLYRGSLALPTASAEGSGTPKVIPSAFDQVTSGRGQHTAVVSPDGRFILDSLTHLELPFALDLLGRDGSRVRRVLEAADPLAGKVKAKSEFFTVSAEDGSTLYGHVFWPPEFDPKKKYPVLQYVYGGPHVQVVSDQWQLGPGIRNLWLHWLATQGVIVFRLDNHGTLNRGIEFQQAVHRRFGTLEVDDQTRGLEWILSHDGADRARVGVHGWSFGGYMTLSLMTRRPDNYVAGIAGAPVTDWTYYETGYGERYMDRPEENADGYRLSAPGAYAQDLKGRLLVVHGTSDDTVVLQHTMRFVSSCIDAGAEVEYMTYPGQKHGLVGRSAEHFFRKMTRFFFESLEVDATPAP